MPTDRTYTVVTLDKRGRYFRPVRNADLTNWRRATRWAEALAVHVPDTTEVWTVSRTVDLIQLGDRDVPIRWDAHPTYDLLLMEA